MREIKYLVIHCSASKTNNDLGAKEIKAYHINHNQWRDIGYHYVIKRNGLVESGRPIEQAGAHVAGYNSHSLGICLIGGLNNAGQPENNFTLEQFKSLKTTLLNLRTSYPKAAIYGHRDFPKVKKACPCFEVASWLKKEGIKP